MRYTKIVISHYKPKAARTKRDENLMYRVTYEGTEADTTGLGGTWQSSGNLYDVYRCQQYMVAQSPFTMTPEFIAENVPDLIDQLREITECNNVIHNQ